MLKAHSTTCVVVVNTIKLLDANYIICSSFMDRIVYVTVAVVAFTASAAALKQVQRLLQTLPKFSG